MPTNQIFESISKLDKDTAKKFDSIVSKEKLIVFKSEYEALKAPAWQTIKDAMENSKVLFILVGPKLVEARQNNSADWINIQNWIAYEIGVASTFKIDVWIICDNNVKINFAVPYLNNYSLGIETKPNGYEAKVLRSYAEGAKFEFAYSPSRKYYCPNKTCGAKYNLHNVLQKGDSIICPSCLKTLVFHNGWQL